jgi:hypothetical protein
VIVSNALILSNKKWPVAIRPLDPISDLTLGDDRSSPRNRQTHKALFDHVGLFTKTAEITVYGPDGQIKPKPFKGHAVDLFT